MSPHGPRPRSVISLALTCLAFLPAAAPAQPSQKPFKVHVEGGSTTVVESSLPVDPQPRLNLEPAGDMCYGLRTSDGKRLTFSQGSARTNFLIDGRVVHPGGCQQQPLPPGPRGKPRTGMLYTWQQNNLRVTQEQVIVPGKPPGKAQPGQKRKMDAALFRYVVENKGPNPVKFGLRVWTDMYNWTTDGPTFAAPTTMPNQILNGVALTGKQVPDYLMSLQNPNLQNPGHVAYYTFSAGRKWERPSKVVLTQHGAPALGNGWDVQVMAFNGDSDSVLFWEEQVLPPGKKREIVYAYGTSLATSPENEGQVTLDLSGSFEPNRLFTLTALVTDPVESQSLQLILPAGMELLEGPDLQPVPEASPEGHSVVLWRARVLRPGAFPVQVRSSNGVTQTRVVTVQPTQ